MGFITKAVFRKLNIITVSLLATVLQVAGQTIVSKPIPFLYNLSSNEIWNFTQDHDGYIWAATTNGIARYDGHRLATFRNDYRHPDILSNNDVVVVVDAGKYLWIGTRKGITLLEKQNFHFMQPKDKRLRDINVSEIVVQGSSVWINATNGTVYKCDGDCVEVKEYQLGKCIGRGKAPLAVNNLYVDHDGKLWGLLGTAGLVYYSPGKDTFLRYDAGKDMAFFVMYQDQSNRYWIGTWGDGLYEFDPNATVKFKRHKVVNKDTGLEDNTFFSIVQDDVLGYIWLLSFNRLYAFRMTPAGSLLPVDIDSSVKTHKMYTRIMKDREGNLWLSSYDDAFIISFNRSPIVNYTLPQLTTQRGWDANILAICVGNSHKLWLNQDRYGVCLYDPQTDQLELLQTINSNVNKNIAASRNSDILWVNDYGSTVITAYRQTVSGVRLLESYDMLTVDKACGAVRQMVEDANGRLWVSTENRKLFVCSSGEIACGLPAQPAAAPFLVADRSGVVWNVTAEGNVSQLFFEHVIRSKVVSRSEWAYKGERVIAGSIDEEGRLWVVTSMGVVYVTNPDKTGIRQFPVDNLLDDCTPLNILADRDDVWFITNKKVIKYNKKEHGYIVYSTNDENIAVNVFRHRASVLDGMGGIYVGGHNGLVHILKEDGAHRRTWNFRPVVSDITVNGQSIVFYNERNAVNSITLNPGDRNLEIFISSLKYGEGQPPRIAYQLMGVDKDWVYLSPEKHSAFYNRLDDGRFQLRMKYEYEPGHWSEAQFVLTIVQRPAWYETWWAYTLYVVIILATAYLLLSTPFEKEKLRKTIDELMRKNKHHEAIMAKVGNREPVGDEDTDGAFLEGLIAEIEAHLMESEYDLTVLAASLNVSKSTLNRKVKALTDMTPLDFIHSVKMKHACQLLRNSRLSVSEIAYSLGFSNPKYFTKRFKAGIGCTPSEYKASFETTGRGYNSSQYGDKIVSETDI